MIVFHGAPPLAKFAVLYAALYCAFGLVSPFLPQYFSDRGLYRRTDCRGDGVRDRGSAAVGTARGTPIGSASGLAADAVRLRRHRRAGGASLSSRARFFGAALGEPGTCGNAGAAPAGRRCHGGFRRRAPSGFRIRLGTRHRISGLHCRLDHRRARLGGAWAWRDLLAQRPLSRHRCHQCVAASRHRPKIRAAESRRRRRAAFACYWPSHLTAVSCWLACWCSAVMPCTILLR